MGKLLDELKEPTKLNRVEQIVAELGADGEDLLVALRDPLIPTARIRQVLLARGFVVAASTLGSWRRDNGVA